MTSTEAPPPLVSRRVGLLIAAIVLGIDQLSKWYASTLLIQGGIPIIPGFFDLVLVHNPGAAFGLFAGFSPMWRTLFLVSVAVFATVFILILLYKSRNTWETVALGLVLGGALGNLIDRLRMGWVVDFIHLHWHDLSWPVFNLADSAISVGVGIMLLNSWGSTGTTLTGTRDDPPQPPPQDTQQHPKTGTQSR